MSEDHFWLNDPKVLFKNPYLIPTEKQMSLEEQFNAFTRLVIILFLILFLFNVKNSLLFFIITLILIFILYYLQKKAINNKMIKENYISEAQLKEKVRHYPIRTLSINNKPLDKVPVNYWNLFPKDDNKLKVQTDEQYRFCKKETKLNFDCRFRSSNQKLVDGVNPKTKIPPVIIPPPAASDYWCANNVVISGINAQTDFDAYRSGYIPSNCCPDYNNNTFLVPGCKDMNIVSFRKNENPCNTKEYYSEEKKENDIATRGIEDSDITSRDDSGPIEDVVEDFFLPEYDYSSNKDPYKDDGTQTYKYPYKSEGKTDKYLLTKGYPGDIQIQNEYNPQQLIEHNIPSNLEVGKCQQQNEFNDYNKNLFTQNIGENMYSRNETIESVNQSLGISMATQFPPTTCEMDSCGNKMFIQRDPRIIDVGVNKGSECGYDCAAKIKPDNVYDPRFYGSGTSYRSYNEPITGQTRYFYNDIDSIRRPNYITRNNVDDAPWANCYGPMKDQEHQDINAVHSRQLANDKFMRDTTRQRSDLQERWFRKYNSQVAWQKRMFPLRRDHGTKNFNCG